MFVSRDSQPLPPKGMFNTLFLGYCARFNFSRMAPLPTSDSSNPDTGVGGENVNSGTPANNRRHGGERKQGWRANAVFSNDEQKVVTVPFENIQREPLSSTGADAPRHSHRAA
jgi:hypothetical protein